MYIYVYTYICIYYIYKYTDKETSSPHSMSLPLLSRKVFSSKPATGSGLRL